MGDLASHHAAVRPDDDDRQAGAAEDAEVCGVVGFVLFIEARLVHIEGVAVLHGELAYPDEARAGARVVPPLGLDLVDEQGHALVAVDLATGKVGDDLLVGHGEDHVAPDAVLEAAHLPVDGVVAPRLLPHIGGVDQRHQDLLASDPLHLLADDGLDIGHRSKPEGQQIEDAGPQLTDESCPQQVFVPLAVGAAGRFAQGSGKEFGHPHRLLSLRGIVANEDASSQGVGRVARPLPSPQHRSRHPLSHCRGGGMMK